MEHGGAPAWAAALESSALGALMRDSFVLYPIANVTHIIGVILLVGGIGVFDLRLLGLGCGVAVPAASRLLTPIAITGLVLMLASGTALFSADARAVVGNPVFRIKLALILFGIANALLFRALWQRRLAQWDFQAPPIGRAQAALSLAGWFGVAICGRLIAYF